MNVKLTLGERLKDLRVERHLKLEMLAEQTGLSKSALSKYESDDVTDLSIYAVTTLAEFYGVTTDYLLGVTENKKRPDPQHQPGHGRIRAADLCAAVQ